MLKTYDRYIIRKFIGSFLFTLVLFTMVSLVVDLMQKIDKFMESGQGIQTIIMEYFIPFIPWINGHLTPIYVLISVVFFTSRLASDNEIIACLSSGMSYLRVLRPFFISACLIGAGLLFANHVVIPNSTKTMKTFEANHLSKGDARKQTNNIHLFLEPRTKIYVKRIDNKDVIRGIYIEKFNEENKLVELIYAREMSYIDSISTWKMKFVDRSKFLPRKYEKNIAEIDTVLNLVPEDFIIYKNEKEMLNTPKLVKAIKQEQLRGSGNARIFEIEKYRRTADSFSIIILGLLGTAIASRKQRGGMGFHLALGVGLGTVFIFLSKVSLTFALSPEYPALLGVWIPNFFFSLITLYLIAKAQK